MRPFVVVTAGVGVLAVMVTAPLVVQLVEEMKGGSAITFPPIWAAIFDVPAYVLYIVAILPVAFALAGIWNKIGRG